MQKSTKEWLKTVSAKIEKQKKAERAKIRKGLKFNPNYTLPKDLENLKFLFPFGKLTPKKYELEKLKNILFLFSILYTCNAFCDDFIRHEEQDRNIKVKLSDFRLLFGYNAKIPNYFTKEKNNLIITFKNFSSRFKLLLDLNYTNAQLDRRKTLQYKAFSFPIVLNFLNKFKAPAIPFLIYILSLYRYSNSPRIQHNARNLLKACKISLKQGKQKAIDRINKYLNYLYEHDIISDEKFYPLDIESLKQTESVNYKLKLF